MKFFQLLFFFMLLNLLSYGQILRPGCNDYVKIEGRSFMCGGQPFYPITAEYVFYPVHFVQNPTSAADYYLSRTNSYGPCSTSCEFESLTGPLALSEIANDFKVIHQMGFNTIRTAGISPNFEYDIANSPYVCPHPPTSLIQGAQWANSAGIWSGTCMEISTASAPDLYREKLFEFIKEILENANANSLKVILDVAYSNTTKDGHINDYLNYLVLLATNIKTLPLNLQQTLLAYVIVEEPQYEGQLGNTKKEICTKVNNMYDVLHAIDPDHLITIGGADVGDVMEWDPGVMKLDFWCPHIYPSAIKDIEPNSDRAVNRVMSQLYWLKNNCPIPWMIGETGFGATYDEIAMADAYDQQVPPVLHPGWSGGAKTYPVVDGELDITYHGEHSSQKNYAEEMLKMVRDCNGSGASWWEFQELWWTNPLSDPVDINGNNYGLLAHGRTDLSVVNLIKKPVVDVFETYLDPIGQPPAIDPAGAQQPPTNYYNPYLFNNSPYTYTGTVKEEGTTIGIKDAVVWGWTKYYKSPNSKRRSDLAYTFSLDNSNGSFTLNTLNPSAIFILNFEPGVDRIEISALGAERENYCWNCNNSLSATPNPAPINCDLKISKMEFDLVITNETVAVGITKNFKAWNSITVSNSSVQRLATSDFTTRNYIHLLPEFHSANGSETHIYTSNTYPECGDYTSFLRLANPNASVQSPNFNSEKEIELSFKSKSSSSLTLVPNPNNGIFTVELSRSEKKNSQLKISVLNYLGTLVYSQSTSENTTLLDLSFLAKGIYFVQVKTEADFFIQKIIIQ